MPQCERISNIEIRNLVKDLFNMLTSEVLVLVTSSPFAEVSSHPLKVIFCEHTTTSREAVTLFFAMVSFLDLENV